MSDIGITLIIVIAIAAILAAAIAGIVKGKRGQRSAFVLVGVLIADWILAAPLAWIEAGGLTWSFPLSLYNVMCMVLFVGSASHLSEIIFSIGTQSRFLIDTYLSLMITCYVATPILVATSVYSVVTKHFSEAKLRIIMMSHMHRNNTSLFLFERINPRSIALVRSLFAKGGSSVKNRSSSYLEDRDICCIFTHVSKNDRERNSDIIEEFSDKNVYYYEQNAKALLSSFSPRSLMRASDLHIAFLSGDPKREEEDLGDVIDFLEFLAEKVPKEVRFLGDNPRFHIHYAQHGENDELALDSVKNIAGFDIRVVDERREMFYTLLWEHPLYESLIPQTNNDRPLLSPSCEEQAQQLDVVLLGCGDHGFEALRTMIWCGQLPYVKLVFYVVDKMPWEQFITQFKHRMPGYFDEQRFGASGDGTISAGDFFSLTYYQADINTSDFDEKAAAIRQAISTSHTITADRSSSAQPQIIQPYCVVTLNGDNQNTDAAVRLRRALVGSSTPTIFPRIHIRINDTRRHRAIPVLCGRAKVLDDAIRGLQMVPIGGMERIFSKEHLFNSDISRLALNINACYSGAYEKGARLTPKENFLGYSLWQMNILSSRAAALALKTKLWILGFRLNEGDDNDADDGSSLLQLRQILDQLRESYDENALDAMKQQAPKLDVLARNEHQRWEAFYYGEGWVAMTPEESNALKTQGLSANRHDSHLLLKHPYLCEYDELHPVSVLLGKEDPRIYDIRMILKIACILNDDAGTSGKKFRVSRCEL